MSATYAWWMPALPFGAALLLLTTGRRQPGRGAVLACGATGVSLLLAILVLARAVHHPGRLVETRHVIAPIGGLSVTAGTSVDGLSALVAVMVLVVAFLVQVYSVSYMHEDHRYPSYAGLVALFTSAMLLVVLSADLLELLVGWEVMGVCSYFLIGHHWEERPNTEAAISAFLVTRLGDLGFTAGIFVIGLGARSFRIHDIVTAASSGQLSTTTLTVGALLLLAGVVGKSAQFPLQTWLPDAMAGPTPISALIHAATMVAAGVYVVARLYPVVAATAAPLDTLAVIAAITMVFGALAALAHDDIKKVLAWSTVSQLAYMYAGLAVGGWAAGVFHLVTHAAFKALLFLAAGSVIHAVGTNSMSRMGGLRRSMPITFVTMTIGLAALAGVPPFAGFFSKDAVIDSAWESGFGHDRVVPIGRPFAAVVLVAALLTALLTILYVTRLWLRVFFGPQRGSHGHESPWLLTGPLVVLAVPAALLGFAGVLGDSGFSSWIQAPRVGVAGSLQLLTDAQLAAVSRLGEIPTSPGIALLSFVIVASGFTAVAMLWRRHPAEDPARVIGRFGAVASAGFFVDRFYLKAFVRPVRDGVARAVGAFDRVVVDGAVNVSGLGASLTGRGLALLQNGNVQVYITAMVVGVVAIVLGVVTL